MTEVVPTVDGVMLTEQLAELVVGLLKAQLPLGVKVTVPVGAVAPDAAVSVTVALQDVAWLTTTLEGVHVTNVDVSCFGGGVPTVTEVVPKLAPWFRSPL